jgi:hypothetical protein
MVERIQGIEDRTVRVGQVRGLQREALGFEISEHGFDGPALAGDVPLFVENRSAGVLSG